MSLWTPLPPAGALPLAPGEVHLVRVPLLRAPAALEALRASLTPEESARADRFHFERDRRRFTVARGVLRRVLAPLVGGPVHLVVGPQGKPALPPPAPLHFNLSHSGELALLAFARGAELGVDLEEERADVDLPAVAATVFSPEEQAAVLAAADGPARQHAFFRQWARKEAVIKAEGWGFSVPSTTFTVRAGPAGLAVHALPGHPPGARPWVVQDVPVAPGYAAALAHAGPGACTPVCWEAAG